MSSGPVTSSLFDLGVTKIFPEQPRPPVRYIHNFYLTYKGSSRYANVFASAASINAEILGIYCEGVMWLSIDHIVFLYLTKEIDRAKLRGGSYRWTMQSTQPWEDAGWRVRSWIDLGIVVEEAGPDGEQGWRLLSREPRWLEEGKGRNRRVVQVRGLPPEQQSARYALEARRKKSSDTRDRTARSEIEPVIAGYVRDLLNIDRDFSVPAAWAKKGFVDENMVGLRLDCSADVVREAHHLAAMNRDRLSAWVGCLDRTFVEASQCPLLRYRRDHPTAIDLPDADAAALDFLV